MSITLTMCIAVLLWSLFPLTVSIGLHTMNAMEMILIAFVIAGISANILGIVYLWKKNLISKAIEIQKTLGARAYIIIIASGIVGVLCHTFFIMALTMANKGGVSLLYESWPVLALIASPFLMRKRWKEVSLTEFLVSIVAMIGVAIIILSDDEVSFNINGPKNLNESMNLAAIGGYILAFAGAYMLALVVITKAAYSEYFSELKDDFGATIIGEMISRIVCIFVVLALYLIMDIHIDQSHINWGVTFFLGFAIFVLGGAFYTYTLLLSTSPTIHVLNYFVPVFAVIWLWIAGETHVNSGLLIGGGIVTLCNIYLVYAGRKAKFSEPL